MTLHRTRRSEMYPNPSIASSSCVIGFNNNYEADVSIEKWKAFVMEIPTGRTTKTPAHARAACGSALIVGPMKSLAERIV